VEEVVEPIESSAVPTAARVEEVVEPIESSAVPTAARVEEVVEQVAAAYTHAKNVKVISCRYYHALKGLVINSINICTCFTY
jgi:hypothetical protein